MTLLSNPFIAPRFRRFYHEFREREFRILDIGCGNHSATLARKYFPRCKYSGVDREIYNNDTADMEAMEQIYLLDLDSSDFSEIPDHHFDVILMSHVIEHTLNGGRVLQILAQKKLRVGGVIYVEFPNTNSLALPNMSGTLNFCDDPTHIRVYDKKEIANALLASGCTIIKAATRRWADRVLLLPAIVAAKTLRGEPIGSCFWDLLGFADFVYARKLREVSPRYAEDSDHNPESRLDELEAS